MNPPNDKPKPAKRPSPKPRRRESVAIYFTERAVLRALALLTGEFSLNAKKTTRRYRLERMAEQMVFLALAHIEVIAPRFHSIINYCEAEELNQWDYLESLIRTKFEKNLHVIDDDDDGGSPVSSERAPVMS